MNEEEIIEKCKIFIDLYNGDSDWDIQDTKEAIQVLLNLYNQAKQQDLKLRLQELPRLQGEIDAYKEFLHQEKEKNKNAINYIKRLEINSIGTPFSYTFPGKELIKILQGEKGEKE